MRHIMYRNTWLLLATVLLTIPMCNIATAAIDNINGPSFDCAKAESSIEKSICFGPDSKPLKKMDLYMSRLYEQLLKSNADVAMIKTEQRKWLKSRNTDDNCKDELVYCYDVRVSEMAKSLSKSSDNPGLAFSIYKDIFGIDTSHMNNAQKYLYIRNFKSEFSQLGAYTTQCSTHHVNIILYKSPLLVTKTTMTSACGGTSYAKISLNYYCEANSTFSKVSSTSIGLYDNREDNELLPEKSELDKICLQP